MNKNLLYVAGAVVGIGGAVAAFSMMSDDDPTMHTASSSSGAWSSGGDIQDAPGPEGVQEPIQPAKPVGNLEKRTPPTELQPAREGQAARRALLDRPFAEFALRSEVTLKVLAQEIRGAGDEAFADEIMAHVIQARKDRYDEDLDGEAFLNRVVGFRDRANGVQGLSPAGVEARDLITELIEEFSK